MKNNEKQRKLKYDLSYSPAHQFFLQKLLYATTLSETHPPLLTPLHAVVMG